MTGGGYKRMAALLVGAAVVWLVAVIDLNIQFLAFNASWCRGSKPREQPATCNSGALTLLPTTYTDRLRREECMSFHSAAVQGLRLVVIGLGTDEWDHIEKHNIRKVYATHKVLEDLARSDGAETKVIFFNDASDVTYVGGQEQVLAAFRRLQDVHGEDVAVFTGERNCWPFMLNGVENLQNGTAICDAYPHPILNPSSSYRYLNSGGWIATVPVALRVVKMALDQLNSGVRWSGDQEVFQRMFLSQSGNPPRHSNFRMVLDTETQIFQSAFLGPLADYDSMTQPDSSGPYFDKKSSSVVNTETVARPALIHFNGPKINFETATRLITETALQWKGKASTHDATQKWFLDTYPWYADCEGLMQQ